MRAVVQRVIEAKVTVDGSVVGSIDKGLLILLGVADDDDPQTVNLMAEKLVHLRIFPDDDGRFNHSLLEIGGSALVVSQFTLFADTRKGRRPSFSGAGHPDHAAPLVDAMVLALKDLQVVHVASGRFGAAMQVSLTNDGPVTLVLDTSEWLRR
ncbi:MAG: D-tyrosyl-tRNA(Tyr) deacylase [Acidobacteria bacterium]|nr:D-tyrosyl-tRNA(Tyr) deacylase [Acidobacteriota bacterium]